jgi:hypothetical protein
VRRLPVQVGPGEFVVGVGQGPRGKDFAEGRRGTGVGRAVAQRGDARAADVQPIAQALVHHAAERAFQLRGQARHAFAVAAVARAVGAGVAVFGGELAREAVLHVDARQRLLHELAVEIVVAVFERQAFAFGGVACVEVDHGRGGQRGGRGRGDGAARIDLGLDLAPQHFHRGAQAVRGAGPPAQLGQQHLLVVVQRVGRGAAAVQGLVAALRAGFMALAVAEQQQALNGAAAAGHGAGDQA